LEKKKYYTTKFTILSQVSMLQAMFSGKFVNIPDNEGYYYIQWDGPHFDYILNYLRSGKLLIALISYDKTTIRELYETITYFAVDGLLREFENYFNLMDPGHSVNILNSIQTSGKSRVTSIHENNGNRIYNPGTLTGPPEANWCNNGCIVDQCPGTKYISPRSNYNAGSTWTSSAETNGYGSLIIDITGESMKYKIERFLLFQMKSDGCTSHFKLYFHKSSDAIPDHLNEEWIPLQKDWVKMGKYEEIGYENFANTCICTMIYDIKPITTRYLKVVVKNDGTHGSPSYIELRQIKAYSSISDNEYALCAKYLSEDQFKKIERVVFNDFDYDYLEDMENIYNNEDVI